MDVNKSGSISFSEFKLAFMGEEREEVDKNALQIPPEILKEIMVLFNQVDSNKDGHLDFTELKDIFSAIGVNIGPTELKAIMKRFDKSGDGVISKEEFTSVMIDKLKTDMMSAQHILEDLRIEFKRADTDNTRLLNMY